MPTPVFPQRKESELLEWSAAFHAWITASPTAVGLTALQASAYGTLHAAFATSYATANNPMTNSKSNVEIKNVAKQNLLFGPGGAWQLVNIIQAHPGTTDTQRSELNIRIPDTDPTPVPVPSESPVVDVISTFGTTIRVKVHQATDGPSTPTGKPVGVKGAALFWFVGASAPVDENAWVFATNTTKNVVDILLPGSTTPGAKVWLMGFWFNNRMQSGPASQPVSVHIPGTLSQAA